MKPRVEVVAIDCLMVRLFDEIAESNMPWMLAACVRLRAASRRIVLVPGLSIGHRVGDGRQVTVLGRTVMATGHAPERRTTIVRNRLRLAPEEFRQSPLHAFRTLRRVAMGTLLAVTVEDDRWAKARASARGALPRRRER